MAYTFPNSASILLYNVCFWKGTAPHTRSIFFFLLIQHTYSCHLILKYKYWAGCSSFFKKVKWDKGNGHKIHIIEKSFLFPVAFNSDKEVRIRHRVNVTRASPGPGAEQRCSAARASFLRLLKKPNSALPDSTHLKFQRTEVVNNSWVADSGPLRWFFHISFAYILKT